MRLRDRRATTKLNARCRASWRRLRRQIRDRRLQQLWVMARVEAGLPVVPKPFAWLQLPHGGRRAFDPDGPDSNVVARGESSVAPA